ncbi:MAG TPA: hypothetical protein VFZ32_10335 [Micromonosporaceae bacterium]
MSLLIQIQDQNHDVVRQFSDGPDQGLLAVVGVSEPVIHSNVH